MVDGLQTFRENLPREAHSLKHNKNNVLLFYKMNGHKLIIINSKHSINDASVVYTQTRGW